MKTQPTNDYFHVGRLSQPVAKNIKRKAANIYVDNNHLRHIENKHGVELAALGFDAMSFIKLVVKGFNRIYKGTGNSIQLVIYNGKPKVTVIELNLVLKAGFYEVKTATIMKKTYLKPEKLLLIK